MPKIGKTKGPLRNFRLRNEINKFLDDETGDAKKTGKPRRTSMTATLYTEKALEYFRRMKPAVRDNVLSGIFHKDIEVQPPKNKSQIKFKVFIGLMLLSLFCSASALATEAKNDGSISLAFMKGVDDAPGLRLASDPKNSRGPLPNVLIRANHCHDLIGGRLRPAANRFKSDDQAKALSWPYHPAEIISAKINLMPRCGCKIG